ncbi:MAG: RNA polymerase sigma factor [Ignavibacteriales bacterium]|nr:MAG: RNA polymerase sigma factor [Ignavibacteriales bacterium]
MLQTDSELIIKAQKGDALAFEELIYRYDKNVLSLVFKYVRDPDEAKDLYQDVFLRVYRGLKNFEHRSEFSTWLFRIATNVCLTYKSRHKKRMMVSFYDKPEDEHEENIFESTIADTGLTPDKKLEDIETDSKIQSALDNLSPKQKMSFVLKHYEGYKIREIAEIMDCKEGTIKKYLFDAVQKLRLELAAIYN